jgi:hypothetical protein
MVHPHHCKYTPLILSSVLCTANCYLYTTSPPPFQWGRRLLLTKNNAPPRVQLSSSFYDDFDEESFYDDFQDFGEIGSFIDPNQDDKKKLKARDSESVDLMASLRARMSQVEEEDEEDDEDDYYDDDEEDLDVGDATFSSVDELIKFAQTKARQKKSGGADKTWEEENWSKPIPHIDKATGEPLDFDDVLKDGVVLIANPAKFYPDIAERVGKKKKGNKGGFMGGLFDDPFPTAPQLSGVSPALLAKFGIMSPPTPDQGADRRATILPVLFLIDRDPVMGCKAVTVNRRSGALIGDLATEWNKTSELGAFFIQPVWEGGTGTVITSQDSITVFDNSNINRRQLPLEMLHMCPYVNGSQPLSMCDGLYWGGDPCEVKAAMTDPRLEKPLTGFDFKFFFKDTRWLPSQLEKEIMDETWIVAQVSKDVIFRNRDRLGPMRSKPLWKEILELLGDDYKHILDLVYEEEDLEDDEDDDMY